MRTVLAASLSAGVAVVMASPAAATAPPPTVPSAAAIAQYVEAVPSATGSAPIGGPGGKASALPPSVRTKVERTAGADASALLNIAQDSRYGARPAARTTTTPAGSSSKTTAHETSPPQGHPQHRSAVHAALPTGTPGPVSAAASTAGSHGFLLVVLLLILITAAAIAARVQRR